MVCESCEYASHTAHTICADLVSVRVQRAQVAAAVLSHGTSRQGRRLAWMSPLLCAPPLSLLQPPPPAASLHGALTLSELSSRHQRCPLQL
eukprot:3755040-Rhodomonas_salina.2